MAKSFQPSAGENDYWKLEESKEAFTISQNWTRFVSFYARSEKKILQGGWGALRPPPPTRLPPARHLKSILFWDRFLVDFQSLLDLQIHIKSTSASMLIFIPKLSDFLVSKCLHDDACELWKSSFSYNFTVFLSNPLSGHMCQLRHKSSSKVSSFATQKSLQIVLK